MLLNLIFERNTMEAGLIPNNPKTSTTVFTQQQAGGFIRWFNFEARLTLPETLLNSKTIDWKFLRVVYYLQTRGGSTDQTASDDQDIDNFIDELKKAATEEAISNSTDTPALLKLTLLLKEAVDSNFPGALKQLADLLCTDMVNARFIGQLYVENNQYIDKATYLKKAADQLNHTEAAYIYAGCSPRNDNDFPHRAGKYLTQAADAGHVLAQLDLYKITFEFEGTKFKYCYSIGVAYLNGNSQYDIQPNFKEAHKHLTLAAEQQKDPRAMYLLKQLSLTKLETASDELLTRAATYGDLVHGIDYGVVEAAYQLTQFIQENPGVVSIHYYEKAANLLFRNGQKLLLNNNKVVDKKAADYFIKAGKLGHKEGNKFLEQMFSDGRGIGKATEDKTFEFFENNPLRTTPHIKRQLQALNPDRYEIFLTKEVQALQPDNLIKYIRSLQRPIALEYSEKKESLKLLADLLCTYPEAREVLGSKDTGFYLRQSADEIRHAGAAFFCVSNEIQKLYCEHFPTKPIASPVTPRVLVSLLSELEQHPSSYSMNLFRIERSYELAARQSHFAAQEIWANRGNSNLAFSMGIEYLYGNLELGVKADEESAIHYLAIAADELETPENKAIAAYLLAVIFEKNGDIEKAGKYLEIAAKLKHVPALLERQIKMFAKAENPNDETKEKMADAAYRLSCLLGEENALLFLRADVEKANTFLVVAAQNGNVNAMQDILLLDKKGIALCDKTEMTHFEFQLSNQTQKIESKKLNVSEESEYHYIKGKMYLSTARKSADYVLAVQSFALAAEQGHIEARIELNKLISNGLGINRKTLEVALSYLATTKKKMPALMEALAAQINKENFQELYPVLKDILKGKLHILILLLEKVVDQIPDALQEFVNALVVEFTDQRMPPRFEPYLQQVADRGHADAAYLYSKILEAREAKLTFFEKLTLVFSKDSAHYLKIAAANGNEFAIQELINRGDISKEGTQVSSVENKPKEYDGHDDV